MMCPENSITRTMPETPASVTKRLKEISSTPDGYWHKNGEHILNAIQQNYQTPEQWSQSPQEVEIATRIHGNPSKAQIIQLLDSLSRQNTPAVSKRATILAHNLVGESRDFLREVSEHCQGALHVVWLDSPIIDGAYHSWHAMMLATTGNLVASFDSDGALPNQWAQEFITYMQQNSKTIAASAPLLKYNTRGLYAIYSKGVELLHHTTFLAKKLNPVKQFRAGNMIARGDAVRHFAHAHAGSRKEDTFFAHECAEQSQQVSFHSQAWSLNDGEHLSSQPLIDSAKRITFAIAWQLPFLKNGSRLNELAARRYVIEDVSRYAPWTKPFIAKWAAHITLTQYDIITQFLTETTESYRQKMRTLSPKLDFACTTLQHKANTDDARNKKIVTAADIVDTLDLISEYFYKTAILEAFESEQNK